MRLFGVEPETPIRDLYSFACDACGRFDVRGVLITPRAAPSSH